MRFGLTLAAESPLVSRPPLSSASERHNLAIHSLLTDGHLSNTNSSFQRAKRSPLEAAPSCLRLVVWSHWLGRRQFMSLCDGLTRGELEVHATVHEEERAQINQRCTNASMHQNSVADVAMHDS